jgi:hypothetical protein
MTALDQQVRRVKHRLWFNRWLRLWGWALLAATALWLIAWAADRLFALHLPVVAMSIAAVAAGLAASFVWLALSRERDQAAAVALDEAADLCERAATGLHARHYATDPFHSAVVADAERRVTGLAAGKLIPLRWPGSLSFSAAGLLIAALSLFLPEFDLLNREDNRAEAADRQAALRQVRNIVSQPVSTMSQIVEKHGDPEMEKQLKALEDALKPDASRDPGVLRRETTKQLDKLQNSLNEKADDDRYRALKEAKKKLRQLAQMDDSKGQAAKLLEAMAAGDFSDAQKEIRKMQESLARRARDGKVDPAQAEEMRKKLNDMAEKLQEAAQDQQNRRDMQNAGLDEKDVQRVLDALAKKDPKQLADLAKELSQRLKEQGVTEQQMKEMMKKMADRMKANEQLKEMGQKMAQACRNMQRGDMQQAGDQLGEAGEMLGEMEQLEQSLNELEAQMSDLSDARDELNEGDDQGDQDGECPQCQGSGFRKDGAPCPHCNGTGNCSGGRGRGSGARDRDDDVDVDFKNTKAKTKTRKGGRIIGQQFVKGQPLAGKSQVEFYDAARAAEIDAADALNRDRIPRAYRKVVRGYFDRLGDDFDAKNPPPTSKPAGPADSGGGS